MLKKSTKNTFKNQELIRDDFRNKSHMRLHLSKYKSYMRFGNIAVFPNVWEHLGT